MLLRNYFWIFLSWDSKVLLVYHLLVYLHVKTWMLEKFGEAMEDDFSQPEKDSGKQSDASSSASLPTLFTLWMECC